MLVLDTSAYINGWKDHYPPATFSGVWRLIESAMDDGRIVAPREVYNELVAQYDDIAQWTSERIARFVEPSPEVQQEAGRVLAMLPNPGERHGADPFVVAEATMRSFTVVTYEGRSFTGVPTRNWSKTMPGICQRLHVRCCTLPEALARLGGSF